MRLLLDTHSFLWFVLDDPKLSRVAKAAIEEPANDIELSRHTALLTTLPQHHRDPFDRLLVVQALSEGISIVSGDPRLDAYGVPRIW